MKPITTSASTFRALMEEGFLYVDKTALLHPLVQNTGRYFFSRPRRFGKSLTLSTLEEILKGHRELFRGLAIDGLPYDWKPYPVIRIDLGDKSSARPEELRLGLSAALRACARSHDLPIAEPLPHLQFAELIELLEMYFPDRIAELGRRKGLRRPAILEKIRDWYNGYRFSKAPISVYNPVSLGQLFTNFDFHNYWFETATPTMLVNLMKEKRFDLETIRANFVSEEMFSAFEVERIDPLPLCFQAGYLTIKDVDASGTLPHYRLDYPNREVEQSFTKILLAGR